ncbi:hypothetical protein [Paenibacillus filicis]|uniref:hypothetical protein n=1 Tax=Paenibacillus filicis TaxID=669464 RepID=UPI00311A8F6E
MKPDSLVVPYPRKAQPASFDRGQAELFSLEESVWRTADTHPPREAAASALWPSADASRG